MGLRSIFALGDGGDGRREALGPPTKYLHLWGDGCDVNTLDKWLTSLPSSSLSSVSDKAATLARCSDVAGFARFGLVPDAVAFSPEPALERRFLGVLCRWQQWVKWMVRGSLHA
jgi:hypothetical protein